MRILLVLFLLLPNLLVAQNAATLLADSVKLNGDDQLIASGNVEVLFEGNRLSATEIVFDRPSDTLQITGPIFIRGADGTLLTAERATLDPRLENGILQSARIVLDQQLQLVANQIDQQDGRYTQLYKTAATSCRVCGAGPPLWEIRAEKVIRDAEELQLYFENAVFLVRGVPVLWLPRMRLPDPALSRSTGLLVPEQRNTTQLGFGFKLPYFITLGDDRDITVTPYLSSQTRTLELVYRQAFVSGDLRIEAAASDDTLLAENRGYLFAQGEFALGTGAQFSFDIETTSDPAYLLDYGYSGKDRLDSAVGLVKVTDETMFRSRLTYYQTLRDDEVNASLPPLIADIDFERRQPTQQGGLLGYQLNIDTEYRPSNTAGDAGRDVTRAGAAASWQQSWVTQNGMVAEVETGARADLYLVGDDPDYPQADLRVAPDARLTLRWPLARRMGSGATHVIAPVVSLAWSDSDGSTPPNEDSTRSTLDQGNLFDVSRFAGDDALQAGPQVAAGLAWTRFGAAGFDSTLSLGRVIAQDANAAFTQSSGLSGRRSDWLVAAQMTSVDGLLIDARGLWDDDGDLTSADGRLFWRNELVNLSANYNWQSPDVDEGRNSSVSEWSVDAAYDVNDAWRLRMDARYDIAGDRPVEAGAGLRWRNECVSIDVSVSRRYTSSTTIEPTTTFGLSGTIGGFSAGRAAGGITTGCGT